MLKFHWISLAKWCCCCYQLHFSCTWTHGESHRPIAVTYLWQGWRTGLAGWCHWWTSGQMAEKRSIWWTTSQMAEKGQSDESQVKWQRKKEQFDEPQVKWLKKVSLMNHRSNGLKKVNLMNLRSNSWKGGNLINHRPNGWKKVNRQGIPVILFTLRYTVYTVTQSVTPTYTSKVCVCVCVGGGGVCPWIFDKKKWSHNQPTRYLYDHHLPDLPATEYRGVPKDTWIHTFCPFPWPTVRLCDQHLPDLPATEYRAGSADSLDKVIQSVPSYNSQSGSVTVTFQIYLPLSTKDVQQTCQIWSCIPSLPVTLRPVVWPSPSRPTCHWVSRRCNRHTWMKSYILSHPVTQSSVAWQSPSRLTYHRVSRRCNRHAWITSYILLLPVT